MSRPSLETDEPALQCSVGGCRRRWANDFGFGRLCSVHDVDRRAERRAEKAQGHIPETLRAAARPWTEPEDADALPF